ncbi:MAG: ABC transporter substrate-binding protein [Myxococcales bacterium]|nr:ABC transporter substrate-binding protein [Myxococcales bacterium]
MIRKALLGWAAAGLLAACTATLDFDDECNQDSQCGTGLRCVQRLCVQGGAGGAGGAGDDMGGDLDAAPDQGPPADRGVDQGPDAQVDQGTAWPPALPPECHTLHGVPADAVWGADTVRFGVLLPSSGALGAFGPSMAQAAFLAVDEVNQINGLGNRKLALIVCDTATDADQSVRLAQWLVQQAKVPAILGPAGSTNALRAFNEAALAGQAVLITPSATSPALTDQQDQNLLWRTAPSDAIQGRAISAYLQAEGLQKVAVVNRDDAYGNGLTEAIRVSLCNARACTEANYFNRRYTEGAGDLSSVFAQVQGFGPDVLVLIAYVEDGVELVNLAALAGIRRLILADGTKDTAMLEQVNDPQALADAVGTAPAAPAGDIYQAFLQRYTAQWGEGPGVFNAQSYDAMYLLAFAAGAAAEQGELTGPALAQVLARLSAGPRIQAGPTDFNRGMGLLRASAEATVDYVGASGELDFDGNGEAPNDIEAWRFDVDGMAIESLGLMYTAGGEYMPVAAAPDMGAPAPEPDMGE